MSSFETYNPNATPVPLNGTFGRLMGSTLGAQQDEEVALLATAMRCHLPAKCPDDALDKLGAKFKIERYDGESQDSYRARLVAAWETWELAGSAEGVEAQLVAAFGCDARTWMIHELDFGPDPLAMYSEFWVVIGPNLGTFAGTSTHVLTAKRIILKWKSAHSYPVELLALTGAPILGWEWTLGVEALGDGTSDRYPIGRTLNGTLPLLGDADYILGGYEI